FPLLPLPLHKRHLYGQWQPTPLFPEGTFQKPSRLAFPEQRSNGQSMLTALEFPGIPEDPDPEYTGDPELPFGSWQNMGLPGADLRIPLRIGCFYGPVHIGLMC